MEKTININGKEYIINEILAIDFDELVNSENDGEKVKKLLKHSSNITEEEYNKLTIRERSSILKTVNEVNGWATDFQEVK